MSHPHLYLLLLQCFIKSKHLNILTVFLYTTKDYIIMFWVWYLLMEASGQDISPLKWCKDACPSRVTFSIILPSSLKISGPLFESLFDNLHWYDSILICDPRTRAWFTMVNLYFIRNIFHHTINISLSSDWIFGNNNTKFCLKIYLINDFITNEVCH